MLSSTPDGPALSRFRHSISIALARHSRAAFEAACRTLCLSTTLPLADILVSPPCITDPQLAFLLSAAADRRWLDFAPGSQSQPSTKTWAGILKHGSTSPYHSFARQTPPRAALLTTESGLLKTSFRRWKWDATSVASSPLRRDPPEPLPVFRDLPRRPDDSSSVASCSSSTPLLQPFLRDPLSRDLKNPRLFLADAEFEASLLASMPHMSDARPAAAAAAGAFRALIPFLPVEERRAIRDAFSTLPPAECLAMVVRIAELASAKHNTVRKHPQQQRSTALQHAVQTNGMLGLSGAERQVWGTSAATGWPDESRVDHGWGSSNPRTRNQVNSANSASGLDVNAAPFAMAHELQNMTNSKGPQSGN